jgi:DNA replication protein DnaC
MVLKILPAKSGEILLEVIMHRYKNRSTMMTSNRTVEKWGNLLCDVPAASAIPDRLLHHAEIIAITWPQLPAQGGSHRTKPAPCKPAEEGEGRGLGGRADRGTTVP